MRVERRSGWDSCSTHRQQQAKSQPRLESLEQRQLLSAAVSHAAPALYVVGPVGIVTPIAPVPPIHIISPIAFTTGNVTGQVTDAEGNPLANAKVCLRSTLAGILQPVLPGAGPAPLWAFPQFLRPQTRVYSATTDAQGNYTIDHVLTGSYTVTAHEKGYANNTSPVFTVSAFTVDAGATIAPTVQLTALVYGNVTGQVTDADGNPLAHARVCLLPAPTGIAQPLLGSIVGSPISVSPIGLPTGQRYFATTDASGNYTIAHVLAGDYTVTAREKGYVRNTSSTFTVAAGENTAPTVQLSDWVHVIPVPLPPPGPTPAVHS